jgi:hypothetical protein
MSTSARSRARRKRIDPAVVILGVLVLAALPVLGFFAYKLLLKQPTVVVETQIVKAPPVKKPVQQPGSGEHPPAPTMVAKVERNDFRQPARQPASDGRPTVATAVERVAEEAHDALGLGKKVLVVWLFDESASAATLRREVTDQFDSFYKTVAAAESAEGKAAAGDDAQVLSVVGGFSDVVKFATEEPEADAQKVSAAAAGLQQASNHVEKPFAAVHAVIEKFGDYRVKKQRWVTIVLVTDEAGDDEAQIDEVLPLLERYSIPVNCIGTLAPFGKLTGAAIFAEGKPTDDKEVRVRQGPESRFPEWIHLDYPNGRDDTELGLDTELGPYSLTRLCKESGGDYFPLSMGGGGDWGGGGWGGGRGRHNQAATGLPRAYAPKYIPEKDLQEQLEKNKAKKALIEAATLPQVAVIRLNTLTVDAEDEVKKQQMLANVQKPAAKLLPPIDKLLDTLRAGEADEPKLTEPRWKAGYDLALGRALAAKARCQGYDDMVATLKTDKFKSDKSTTWILDPSDEPTGISVDDKMAVKAREYLNRVIKEHPGTPWASSATRELEGPIGWKKSER